MFGAWFSSPFSTFTSVTSSPCSSPSYTFAVISCHPFSNSLVFHSQTQLDQSSCSEVSVASCHSPSSIRTQTPSISSPSSGSSVVPLTSTTPSTVLPCSGCLISITGAWFSSPFSTFTSIESSPCSSPSYTFAVISCHPFSNSFVFHSCSQLDQSSCSEVSVASCHSPSSIRTQTPSISSFSSGSSVVPLTSTTLSTVLPCSGCLISITGGWFSSPFSTLTSIESSPCSSPS